MGTGPNPLTPISASLPITQDGKLPNPDFIIQLNNLLAQIGGQITSISAAQQQAAAAAAAAALAQQTANNPPSTSGRSGSANESAVTIIDTMWVVHCLVSLTGVVANNLTANVTITFGTSPAIAGGIQTGSGLGFVTTANCEFRIRENPSGTIVFPPSGQATFVAYTNYAGGGVINNAQTALASFVLPETTAGAISYQLELLVDTPTTAVQDLSLYLFVNRS